MLDLLRLRGVQGVGHSEAMTSDVVLPDLVRRLVAFGTPLRLEDLVPEHVSDSMLEFSQTAMDLFLVRPDEGSGESECHPCRLDDPFCHDKNVPPLRNTDKSAK
jgi:hypothetical protein